jgi:hypothetical protein
VQLEELLDDRAYQSRFYALMKCGRLVLLRRQGHGYDGAQHYLHHHLKPQHLSTKPLMAKVQQKLYFFRNGYVVDAQGSLVAVQLTEDKLDQENDGVDNYNDSKWRLTVLRRVLKQPSASERHFMTLASLITDAISMDITSERAMGPLDTSVAIAAVLLDIPYSRVAAAADPKGVGKHVQFTVPKDKKITYQEEALAYEKVVLLLGPGEGRLCP